MPTADSTSSVFLKTPAGRKYILEPPITIGQLLDVAANQLLLEVSNAKFFLNGSLLYAAGKDDTGANANVLQEEIIIPGGRSIIVVAKPLQCVAKWAAAEAMRKKVDIKGSREPPDQSSPKRSCASPLSPSENASPPSGGADELANGPSLYEFMKQFIFLQGRRGLRQMLYIARNQYGDFPRSLQDHQTMVSIVEYVDRDPTRLRDVLHTILEEEPDLFRWIEANSEVFLAIINGPVHRQEAASPVWLIRNMTEAYHRQNSKCGLPRRFGQPENPQPFHGSESPQQNGEVPALRLVAATRPRNLETTHNAAAKSSCQSDILVDAKYRNAAAENTLGADEEGRQLVDESIEAVQTTCNAWEVAKDRWMVPAEGNTNVQVVNHLMCSRLREAQESLLQSMEGYMVSQPPLSMLQKVCELGQQLWQDGEQWLIKQNDVLGAFQHALACLLFETGRDLLTDFIDANSKSPRGSLRKKIPAREGVEYHPLLDPSVSWITPSGPESLANMLRDYTVREEVTVVVYTKLSPNHANAYVIHTGRVYVEPLIVDDTARYELEDLEVLYSLISSREFLLQDPGMRKVTESNWNDLMVKLYKRFISPIGMLLPQPAHDVSSPLCEVKQVCFIHTWSSRHIPIPFHALLNPVDSKPCVLRWAPFVAERPWHLLVSEGIPWSTPVPQSPVITRLTAPIAFRREPREPDSCLGSKTNMVTYVNVNGTHCSSFGEKELNQPLGVLNNGPVADEGGMWQDVPWKTWLTDALGDVRAGIPTHASMFGRDERHFKNTALLIHEVTRGSGDDANCEANGADGSAEVIRAKTHSVMMDRRVPYNQGSDLFVSHVCGRESGVGIHRCALLPAFKVSEYEPIEVYNAFFRLLVETENATTAQAYRMALLESWSSNFKEEPWRYTSVMLFNYGGPMKTLEHLCGEGSEPLSVVSEETIINNVSEQAEVPRTHTVGKRTKRLSAHRDTTNGRYVEGRAIDVIYDVVLHGLSTSRPEGMVAILDCMIGCIEKNRISLEKSIKRRQKKQDKASKQLSLYLCSRSSPTGGHSARGSPGTASARGKAHASRGNCNKANDEVQEGVISPPSGRGGKRSPFKRR
ncbi:XPC-binding domain containing protein, putative [Trypanosoma equiperdum]|uniref:XPC-binding domain containing protein, putative n=1 Tax=Trypanosoma equiperdum TaxID=5694 RepID=A0A1G4I8N7_TRYEQ|nr:XPC-binding domain containing protein, putative [Trypanosoma equiperdum]